MEVSSHFKTRKLREAPIKIEPKTEEQGLLHRTQGIDIINMYDDPVSKGYYGANNYYEPNFTLKFLETFIPDDRQRKFVLSFIRTKFTTFSHSSTILCFHGGMFSGKDLFLSLLSKIVGSTIPKPSYQEFVAPFNYGLVNTADDKIADFIHLDDYNERNHRPKFIAKLKDYASSKEIPIRGLHKDSVIYPNAATFVLTASTTNMPVDMNNRRMAMINTPNKLDKLDWVKDMGGTKNLSFNMIDEVYDFCYYLATKVENLSTTDYTSVPEQFKLFK